ncbi:MAG: glycosyltransferase family 4 protein [bacterium]
MKKIRAVFISESIRRDSHAPLRFFKDVETIHLYLNAPYGDMGKEDFAGSRQVEISNLLSEIIALKPDIIQGAEPFGSKLSLKLAYISYRAARKTRAKLVVPILENRPIEERFNTIQKIILTFFCRTYFNFASAIVVLNRGAEVNVKRFAPGAKIKRGIVWGVWGVDTRLFKKVCDKKPNTIIYVGRWIEDKGLKYMLEGFKKAQEKMPHLLLRLAGQGDFEEYMRDYCEVNGLEKNVEFIGMVKNTELPKYLSEAELSIYPSITQRRWEEQVGTVNFQSMACETPALTTKSGAIPEYLQDSEGAILVPERDSEAICRGIMGYFSSKEKIKLQKRAREFIMRYDIKGEIEKAENLFKEVLK